MVKCNTESVLRYSEETKHHFSRGGYLGQGPNMLHFVLRGNNLHINPFNWTQFSVWTDADFLSYQSMLVALCAD